jgi:hypothetical protein
VTDTDQQDITKGYNTFRRGMSSLIFLIAGLVLVLGAIRFYGYTGAGFAMFVLFAFPVPVFVGFAIGTALPHRGLMWTSAWTGIIVGVLAIILSGVIDVTLAANPSARIISVIAASLIAGISSAKIQKIAITHSAARGTAAIVVFVSLATVLTGYGFAVHNMYIFQRKVIPQVLLTLDSYYFKVSDHVGWEFRYRPDLRCFEITSFFHKRPITALINSETRALIGISYNLPPTGAALANDRDARRYLISLGFRPRLSSNLSRESLKQSSTLVWSGGFESTHLVLKSDGSVKLSPIYLVK